MSQALKRGRLELRTQARGSWDDPKASHDAWSRSATHLDRAASKRMDANLSLAFTHHQPRRPAFRITKRVSQAWS